MLIGRDPELAAVDRLLGHLAEREGGALLLVGEAGIGKTSVLAEAVARARGAGARVAAARAAEFERDVPFALLDALLDEALVDPPPRLEPEVEPGRLGEVPRHRLHRGVRALLEGLSAGRRLLLVADDLHWSDEASLEALLALVHRPPRGAVALLCAARPGAAALRLTEALRSRTDAERAELAPLAASDAARLVGGRHSRRERAAILEAAGGNPFYLQELSRAGPLPAVAPGSGPIPAAVLAAVQAETAQLPPAARTLLAGAAIAGDPFDLDVALAACGAADATAADALLAADLVRPDGRVRRLRFRHPIVRAAVQEAAGPAFRAAAHERVAAALAASGASAAAQAVHVEQIARPGDLAAADLLARAGEEAAVGAPATAARWYGAALELLGPGQRDRRMLWLGEHSRALTAVGRFEDAEADLRAAAELAPPVPHPVALALVEERGHVLNRIGRREAARRLLEEALELAEPGTVGATGLALELANQAWFMGDASALLRFAERARDNAAGLEHPELAAGAAAVSALAASEVGDVAAADAYADEAAALVAAMPDEALARRLSVGHQVAFGHLTALRFRETAEIARRVVAVARASGDEAQMARMLQVRALALTFAGGAAEAAEAADLCLDAARVAGSVPDVWDAAWTVGFIELYRGDLETAAVHADTLEQLRREMATEIRGVQGALVIAMVRDAQGDPARAARVLDAAGYRELATGGASSAAAWFLAIASRIYAAAGELDPVRDAAESLRVRADDPHARIWLHSTAAEYALATAADARPEADAALATSPDVPLMRMWATGVAGRAHAAAGDRETAVARFEALAAESAALGYGRFTEEAARELRRLGRRLAPRTAAASSGGLLTEREREIVELAAAGRTNKEIARTVFLSEKTVEGHLSRAFAKLGVRSRVELAAALAGQGTGEGDPS